jgi:TRAP-type C4-dicarboxylate transport system permease small subunit
LLTFAGMPRAKVRGAGNLYGRKEKPMAGEWVRSLEKGLFAVSKVAGIIGACALIVMVMVIVVDVTIRLFDIGVPGSYEIVELAMVPLVFFVIAQVQARKKNIDMDLLYVCFSKRGRAVIDLLIHLVSLVLFVFFTYASVLQAMSNYTVHEASAVLLIPLYLFNVLAALGLGLLCLVLLADLFTSIRRLKGEKPPGQEMARAGEYNL